MESSSYAGGGGVDPVDVPAVLEIFSTSADGRWFVGLVVKQDAQNLLTIRFLDEHGERKEKVLSCDAPEVDYFGTHLGWPSPPGVVAVPSTTRKGQVSYLDPNLKQKFATPELAWQAHLEHHLSDFASAPPCSAPVPLPLESKVVVAPTLRPDVGPRAGRRSTLSQKISENCAKSLDRADLATAITPAGIAGLANQSQEQDLVPSPARALYQAESYGGSYACAPNSNGTLPLAPVVPSAWSALADELAAARQQAQEAVRARQHRKTAGGLMT